VRLRGLYAITPEHLDRAVLLEKTECALRGGVALLQYRSKAPRARRAEEARALATLTRRYGVPLIINDDVELALEVGADGVHLGRGDGSLVEARSRLEGKLLGASCYDQLELAERAVAAGADYVAFGSVYPSPTKPGAVRAPLALFTRARELKVPLCAIGGITLKNAGELVRAGADLAAVVSDLFDAADIAGHARAYAKVFA
jgi:thiamine-phosphate pyrophosphorylase